MDRMCAAIASNLDAFDRGLVRPHPMFQLRPAGLDALMDRLTQTGKPWEIVEVSGRHEVAIELYARGVRVYFCGASSLTETVDAYEDYFSGLRLIKI